MNTDRLRGGKSKFYYVHMGIHSHENPKGSEATFGIYDLFWDIDLFWAKEKGAGRGPGYQISEVRMGDVQVVEAEGTTHSRNSC